MTFDCREGPRLVRSTTDGLNVSIMSFRKVCDTKHQPTGSRLGARREARRHLGVRIPTMAWAWMFFAAVRDLAVPHPRKFCKTIRIHHVRSWFRLYFNDRD